MEESMGEVYEGEITQFSRVMIYILSVLFMPMGFLVSVYLITHEKEEYKEIGETCLKIIGALFGLVLFFIFVVLGDEEGF